MQTVPASLESSSWLCVSLSRGNLGLDTNNEPMMVLPYDRLPAAAPTLCWTRASYFYLTNQVTILRIGSNLELQTYCLKSLLAIASLSTRIPAEVCAWCLVTAAVMRDLISQKQSAAPSCSRRPAPVFSRGGEGGTGPSN